MDCRSPCAKFTSHRSIDRSAAGCFSRGAVVIVQPRNDWALKQKLASAARTLRPFGSKGRQNRVLPLHAYTRVRFFVRRGTAHLQCRWTWEAGAWVRTQRTAFRRRKLTPERIEKLEALDGWVWQVS